MDLVTIWAAIIAFSVFAYVAMDGFDLGIALLFPFFAHEDDRSLAMNSIAPYWDGNETWLVMGGGGLLAVFPVAYAILLPATYPLIIAMLLGLVFRGVAFEFRWRDARHRPWWDRAFVAGSLVATVAQGMILGALLQGVKVVDKAYAGGLLDWLSPYSLLTGAALVLGYALLGATWLVWRTSGSLQAQARALGARLAVWVLGAIAVVSLATIFLLDAYWQRWLAFPRILLCLPVPLLTAWAGWKLITSVQRDAADHVPFLMALALFLLGYCGLGISLYPDMIPPSLTIRDAAAPPESLSFLLAGAAFIIPMILAYTGWAYWVFRGKTATTGGDH
jgi:cytochrome d ubiquinol oxidase subunit II